MRRDPNHQVFAGLKGCPNPQISAVLKVVRTGALKPVKPSKFRRFKPSGFRRYHINPRIEPMRGVADRRAGSVRRTARLKRVRPVRRASSRHSIAAAWSLILVRFRTSRHRGWCAPSVAGDGAAARGPLRDTRPRLLNSMSLSMIPDADDHHGRVRGSRLPSQIRPKTSRHKLLTSRLALSASRKARNLSRRVRSASQRLPSLYEAGGAHVR